MTVLDSDGCLFRGIRRVIGRSDIRLYGNRPDRATEVSNAVCKTDVKESLSANDGNGAAQLHAAQHRF